MWIANHFLKNFACPNSKEFLRVILGVILVLSLLWYPHLSDIAIK